MTREVRLLPISLFNSDLSGKIQLRKAVLGRISGLTGTPRTKYPSLPEACRIAANLGYGEPEVHETHYSGDARRYSDEELLKKYPVVLTPVA